MNIDELTIGEAKELKSLLSGGGENNSNGLNGMIGQKVIIRTYSAGVHFGTLSEKAGSEVILKNARRLYYWKTNGGISLSEVATTGLHNESKVCTTVRSIWLDAIEIIPCTTVAADSIEAKNDFKA